MRIKTIGIALLLVSGTSMANIAVIEDELGEQSITSLKRQLNTVLNETSKLQTLINQREDKINFINKTNAYQFFTVKPGSLREQINKLATASGVKLVRWSKEIPASCDWRFDSSFKIDVTNKKSAFEEYTSGLPMYPEYVPRDNSINIQPLTVIEDCL